jgi:hypothetical protein
VEDEFSVARSVDNDEFLVGDSPGNEDEHSPISISIFIEGRQQRFKCSARHFDFSI